MTPNPSMYQTVNPEQKYKQNFAPFNTLLPRFKTYSKDTYFPGYVSSFPVHFNKDQQERKYKEGVIPRPCQLNTTHLKDSTSCLPDLWHHRIVNHSNSLNKYL